MKNSINLNKHFLQKNSNPPSSGSLPRTETKNQFTKSSSFSNSNKEKENGKIMNMQFNIQTNVNSRTNSHENMTKPNGVTNIQNNAHNNNHDERNFHNKNQNRQNRKNEKNSILNWNILHETLRVIDADGKMLGVYPKNKAVNLAKSKNLDLVLIDDRQNPPIAKILNYEKYRFEKQKQDRLEKNLRKKQNLDTKEIYFRPTTGDHDIQIKLKQSREFLQKGHKVLFSVKMKGREVTHSNLAVDILKKVKDSLSDVSQIARDIQSRDNQVSMILQPKK